MKAVYMIGSYSTKFGKWIEATHKDLARETYTGVMKDAGIDSEDIGSLWFSNCGWGLVVPPAGDDPGIQGQQKCQRFM